MLRAAWTNLSTKVSTANSLLAFNRRTTLAALANVIGKSLCLSFVMEFTVTAISNVRAADAIWDTAQEIAQLPNRARQIQTMHAENATK